MYILSFAVKAEGTENHFQFIENNGQWENTFLYRANIPGGELFIEKGGLTYHFWDQAKMDLLTSAMHDRKGNELIDFQVKHHVIRVNFLGANPNMVCLPENPFSHYYNFYLGNEPDRWKSNVLAYHKVTFHEIYPNIDLQIYTSSNQLKYDWIIKPGGNIEDIRIAYQGADKLSLKNGNFEIKTSLGNLIEEAPFVYQKTPNGIKQIQANYSLKKNILRFELQESFDLGIPLIVDPALIFSTYSGSQKDNWGFTATYDSQGHLYGGGIVLAANAYPNTTGSYQSAYGGGLYDVLIGKFSIDGSTLLYYTYLGGSRAEVPFSLVCNNNDDLYILGMTGSSNFAVSSGAYQTTFNGGQPAGIFALNGNDYPDGSDLFVTKLNSTGTTLVASTYIGGTANDGMNTGSGLRHNYADEFRGEIIVDNNDRCYVTSCTKSIDFPTVNAAQNGLAGTQDAVVFRFSSLLDNLEWSTYLGGMGYEAGYSLKVNNSGEVFVTGGTNSPNFPSTTGAVNTSLSGGVDGFITRYSSTGNLLSSTYLGTTAYDQCYILQLDNAQDVYVVGQTRGNYPIVNSASGPVYSNPNSGQFIHKLNPSLTTTIFSTVFGRGIAGQIDIVPTAFLVDVCDHIYVSGWGGSVNNSYGGGNTSGMPITSNAYQSTTDGSDFYFIVLDENATGLIYASYFGGTVSAEHVDGGTSRFNPDGIVYQAVCAGCGSNDDFPTTPGAWSNTNNSNNCNMGVFKFDVSEFTAIIDLITPNITCINNTVILQNASTGGSNYFWDLGDGTTSTSPVVNHVYTNPGIYNIMLVVSDPASCLQNDTAFMTVIVQSPPNVQITPVNPLCPGDSVQLQASGGDNYSWSPHPTLSATNIANPVATPTNTTTYTVTVTNNCGTATASITVNVHDFNPTISPNDTICIGNSTQLQASGGINYQWQPSNSLDNPNISNPTATPSQTTTYTVTITDANGCNATKSVTVTVDNQPQANAGADQNICFGESTTLSATGGTYFQWLPPTYLSNPNISNPICTPLQSVEYTLIATNICGQSYDTVQINVIRVNPQASNDTIICPGTTATLWASGGVSYSWQPTSSIVGNSTNDTIIVSPTSNTNYTVIVTDQFGCSETEYVSVNVYPKQDINVSANAIIPIGGSTQLFANGNGIFSWEPDSFLTCNNCPNPIASPLSSTQYIVTLTDANGCKFYDSVWVYVEGSIFVPNTFTPNRDGINDFFFAYGSEIKEFEMLIFNRWGEEIFKSNSLQQGWDGTHKGKKCPIGVYVWRILYTETSGKEGLLLGHVNLLR